MSGYLQRLVRSVTQPAETVHPVVGSMFSASQRVTEQEMRPANEDILSRSSSAEQQSESTASQPKRALEADYASILLPPHPQAAAERKPVSPEERFSFQPLMPTPPSEDSPTTNRTQDRNAVERITQSTEPTEKFSPSSAAALPARSKLSPVSSQTLNPVGGIPTRQTRSSFDRVEHRTAQAPEEIQIHIGRIEVTAVQQAPARAPLKPARKRESLDDYLRRRDRSA